MSWIFVEKKENTFEGRYVCYFSSLAAWANKGWKRKKKSDQQIGTEMPRMFNVKEIQKGVRKKYNMQCQTNTTPWQKEIQYAMSNKYNMVAEINTIFDVKEYNIVTELSRDKCQTNTIWWQREI